MPKQWQTIQIPIAAGLSQKSDHRASNPPFLDRAVDIQFDEVGGVQTRKPLTNTFTTNILGGGTLSNIRKLFAQDGELCAWTDTALYAWNEQQSKWVLRATHLACKVSETTHFASMGDDHDTDRAELNGTILFTWTAADGHVYAAALDKATGSVMMQPTAIASFTTSAPVRVIAASTKFLVFGGNVNPDFIVIAVDPANPSAAITSNIPTVVRSSATFNLKYDVCRKPSADIVCAIVSQIGGAGYFVATVDSTAAVVNSQLKARACADAFTIACDPTSTYYQVIRGTELRGDRLAASNLADQATNVAIPGTFPVGGNAAQVTAVYRLVTDGGFYRCYYFINAVSAGAPPPVNAGGVYSGWIDTNGSVAGSFTSIASATSAGISLGSKAFAYGTSAFVTVLFDGAVTATATTKLAVQNTYFTYRDDSTLYAKQGAARAGGSTGATSWYLPSVTLTATNTYSWAGNKRRLLTLGEDNQGYGSRTICDIALTFDANEARRSQTLGLTRYIAAGECLQYDGSGLFEIGFHLYPWLMDNANGTGVGGFAAGTYTWKPTFRWINARGESERSTSASYATAAIGAGTDHVVTGTTEVTAVTHKTGSGYIKKIAVEYWRTVVSPPPGAPFFRVTSADPTTTGNNQYLGNGDGRIFRDAYTDTTLALQEANPENEGVLENLAPPPATIIQVGHSRVFLAGIPDDPTRIVYSKTRGDGEIVAFNDGLSIVLPSDTGAITALDFNEEQLVAFTETAIYVIPGDGFDNAGGGSNYGPVRIVATDVGAVNAESVTYTPLGLVFKSLKGWYLLSGWSPKYIGAPVFNYDSETIVGLHVVEAQHQVRALSGSRLLVYDYLVNQWAEWSITGGVSAEIWNGTYVYATSSAVFAEQTTYSGTSYGLDVETSWIKLADLQGAGRVRWLEILGEYRSAHSLRVRVARDYATDAATSATLATRDLQARLPAPPNTIYASPVKHSLGLWRATLTATTPGDAGNFLTLSIAFKTITGLPGPPAASSALVHDNQVYDPGSDTFIACTGNVGVLVSISVDPGQAPPDITLLETSINSSSALCQVTSHDPYPTGEFTSALNLVGLNHFRQFNGGADASGATYVDDTLWTPSPTTVGGPLQVRIGPSIQRCESFKVRMTAVQAVSTVTSGVVQTTYSVPSGEALKLSGLGLEVGLDRGVFRNLPSAQKG